MPGEATEHLLAELGSATCAVPFENLGLHERTDGPGIVLRVWQPAWSRARIDVFMQNQRRKSHAR